jgi:fructose-1,6-bisphosphatase/inositol monophosphatase family enzyme
MERLRRKDAEAGVVDTPVTDEQRAAIAEARRVAEAKVAEAQIMHRSRIAAVFDPAERAKAEDEHRTDLQRIADERDRKVERIRSASSSS